MPGAEGTEDKTQNQPGAEDDKSGNKDKGEAGAGDKAGEGGAGGEGGELDVSKLDPKVQKLIKDLRTENAGHRTQNKNLGSQLGGLKKALVGAGVIEDDSQDPEEKIKDLSGKAATLEFRSAILESALEHGIGKEDLEYFEFLVSKRAGALEEGQELSEENMAEIAKDARKKSAPVDGKKKSTSVDGDKNPPPDKQTGVTLEQFVKMSIMEKSDLYVKNQALYDQLSKEAKDKKLLIR